VSDGRPLIRPTIARLPACPPGFAPGAQAAPLGAERVVLLGLNEGHEPPFPSALEAIAAGVASVNRYPSRGSGELVGALAEHHGVTADEVFVSAGADAAIGYVCQACLDPGDEAIIPWPSFPSFVRDTEKRDAVPVLVPLSDWGIDVDAVLAAVTPQTRIVFVATPNNPTGLSLDRSEVLRLSEGLPEDVLLVVDEAYFHYLDHAATTDAIEDVFRTGRPTLVLRTFSKLYGLAGLRVGYAIGPAAVVDAMRRVQRGYDVGALSQAAALASLADADEVERRRVANAAAVKELAELLERHGLDPIAGSRSNFVLARVGERASGIAEELQALGVIVQLGAPFGAPGTLRITAGSEDDRARLDRALTSVFSAG
jgi:histidinol-phosphate aminotransferase